MKPPQNQKLALLSVTDKTGLDTFAKGLIAQDFAILSTGGTAAFLRDHDITVYDVASYTGSPEILGGRVKTLHPKIHGGILFDRDSNDHSRDVVTGDIRSIDLVVVNLYQFHKEALSKDLSIEKAIEFIDIGGPCMLRAAAKNHRFCAPIIDPNDYAEVLEKLSEGELSTEFRTSLAIKVFAATSRYDAMIADYCETKLTDKPLPESKTLGLEKLQSLRYGENPKQTAALYKFSAGRGDGFADIKVLQGKELSYNNLLDLDAATAVVMDFPDMTAVTIMKHTNPCGAAASRTLPLVEIYKKALAGDPKSAFGGITAINTEIDADTAKEMSSLFLECIAAPSYSEEALKIFSKKKNLRLVEAPFLNGETSPAPRLVMRSVRDGLLVQTEDLYDSDREKWKTVTNTKTNDSQMDDLDFAMRISKHVKSNAIVYAKDLATVTIGAGQMSRIDAAQFAADKAKDEDKYLAGAVMASDAFFPFRDCVDLVAKVGIKGIIQPGGSKRDQESIDASNENDIAMVFTGERHFRH